MDASETNPVIEEVHVHVNLEEREGSIERSEFGMQYELEWVGVEDKYRKSGDWVEEGDEIAVLTYNTNTARIKEYEEVVSRWFFEDKVVKKTKEEYLTLKHSHSIKAPRSGYILRLWGPVLSQANAIQGPIALISPTIKFVNDRGGIERVLTGDMSDRGPYEPFDRSEKVVFRRSRSHLDRVNRSECTKADSGQYEYEYGWLYGLRSGKKLKSLKRSYNGMLDNDLVVESDHEYIYYLVDDGHEMTRTRIVALAFRAEELLPTETEGYQKEGETGYVYVLVSSEKPGIVKIGMTNRTAEERANELTASTGVSMPYIVAYSVETSNPLQLERKIHAHFSEKRINPNREFFRVSVQEAIQAIEKHT